MTISILCGGSGTRLWPLSRELLPKQFAPILPPQKQDSNQNPYLASTASEETSSLFAKTLLRNADFCQSHNARFSVITNDKHFFLAQDIANQVGITINSFLLESVAKNTAPALCFAALNAFEIDEDEIILALPSDHLISNQQAYVACIQKALELSAKGFLVTFGIKPDSAHTGYGYIKAKDGIVEQFVEKPNKENAQKYLESKNYFWNSGMFCFKANVFLRELETHAPELYNACKKAYILSKEQNAFRAQKDSKSADSQNKDSQILRLLPNVSEEIEEISIDYALMEKSTKVACVDGDFIWNDVGGFEALKKEWQEDSQGNAHKSDLIALDSHNNFVISQKLVATIGVENLAIIDSGDCTLIAPLSQTQRIKEVVNILKTSHPELTQIHNTAHRPWGTYSVLLESSNYKIKQIVVKPRKRLSLQKHFHRNEHWIVVSGSAIVTIGQKELFLKANQSTYIPMGETHRLENPGKIPLVLIEVQMGEYLGEDDIVRLEDDFARR
ncbi:mannose-1-phosphate guanylyltransferase/mannose-6-phosphate isomerase [Helicobacter himalayensis]|uniref:mannose-1-phosphate guanylyltransferase/mannose-6-phosphate isomerase n=1 Tax=Helicobacter himalayensis TaxID=1591088 RepID=UPI000833D7F9|nr:mannose-1-phosphate guanylyltransferase/mannose-6-phosphate isomerase [Helicobacter himalayensis]